MCCLSSSTSPWGLQAVEEFRGGGGAWTKGDISSYEQIILNILSSLTYTLNYKRLSKGQILSYIHLILSYIHMTILTTYSFLCLT